MQRFAVMPEYVGRVASVDGDASFCTELRSSRHRFGPVWRCNVGRYVGRVGGVDGDAGALVGVKTITRDGRCVLRCAISHVIQQRSIGQSPSVGTFWCQLMCVIRPTVPAAAGASSDVCVS